ncbi:hypothetical protein [Hyphobacterium sp.]|uniref:hypothetical protein n=1 Tax=Hyphobacterium sp. TaxID=2004662 RepID=UPI003BAD9F64
MSRAAAQRDQSGSFLWPDIGLAILPSLLGFTLGGMAILLAVAGTEQFKRIFGEGKDDSLFVKELASMFHFVFIQSVAIIVFIVVKYSDMIFISYIGFFLLIYSLSMAISLGMRLFMLGRVLNALARQRPRAHVPFKDRINRQ